MNADSLSSGIPQPVSSTETSTKHGNVGDVLFIRTVTVPPFSVNFKLFERKLIDEPQTA
jgi:hypothetical protein